MPPAALLALLTLTPAATDGDVFDFDARLALGAGTRLDRTIETNLAFEAGILFRVRLDGGRGSGPAPTLMPELSYVAMGSGEGFARDDQVIVGCGYGVTYGPLVTGVVPGLVFGDFRGSETTARSFGGGLRLLLVAELKHILGVQAGYAGGFAGGEYVHEVHASVSLNFLGLAVLYIAGSR